MRLCMCLCARPCHLTIKQHRRFWAFASIVKSLFSVRNSAVNDYDFFVFRHWRRGYKKAKTKKEDNSKDPNFPKSLTMPTFPTHRERFGSHCLFAMLKVTYLQGTLFKTFAIFILKASLKAVPRPPPGAAVGVPCAR